MRYFIINIIFLITVMLKAQNVGINATASAPKASAMLDVKATDKGLLISRVALLANKIHSPITRLLKSLFKIAFLLATKIHSPITSPTLSLLVYNTSLASSSKTIAVPGYYYWDAANWLRLLNSGTGSSTAWLLNGNAGTISGTDFIGTTDVQDLVFKTNNTEKMRVLSNSNVGIGATAPTDRMHIVGGNSNTLKLDNTGQNFTTLNIANNNSIRGQLFFDLANNALQYGTTGALRLGLITNTTERLTITLTGNLGVGTITPNPNSLLELTSTNQGLFPPRFGLTSTTSFAPLSVHEQGMVVYNTATINDVTQGLYINDGANWVKLNNETSGGVFNVALGTTVDINGEYIAVFDVANYDLCITAIGTDKSTFWSTSYNWNSGTPGSASTAATTINVGIYQLLPN